LNVRVSIHDYVRSCADQVEEYFKKQINAPETPPLLSEAMSYSFLAGGKRLRPALAFAANNAVGGTASVCIPVACAIEMIHTYSLIHDDLPAMDNDDYRRGKLTNHKVYGEAMAILAGDGLLTHAFHVLSSGALETGLHAEQTLRMVQELSKYAGIGGMVGGQVNDMLGEKESLSRDQLEAIHVRKTGDLIVFSLRAGGICGGASEEQLNALTRFGYLLGLAFQIQDDILDVIGDEIKLGKKVGSDQKQSKSTYPSLIGLEQSVSEVQRLMNEAHNELSQARLDGTHLKELAHLILNRDK
jgi:geranylgeranyl diphosphate synthase type II